MQGKIVKGISGFYYVHVGEPGIYECKAKGAFRNQKIKPLVGDDVEIAIVDEETKKGNIEKILPRKNELCLRHPTYNHIGTKAFHNSPVNRISKWLSFFKSFSDRRNCNLIIDCP